MSENEMSNLDCWSWFFGLSLKSNYRNDINSEEK